MNNYAGVQKVFCQCGQEMERTGGIFGGDEIVDNDTYACPECKRYVLVLTPNNKHQEEFREKMGW